MKRYLHGWFPLIVTIGLLGGIVAITPSANEEHQRAYELACEVIRDKLPPDQREDTRFPVLGEGAFVHQPSKTPDDDYWKGMVVSSYVDTNNRRIWWSVVMSPDGIMTTFPDGILTPIQ